MVATPLGSKAVVEDVAAADGRWVVDGGRGWRGKSMMCHCIAEYGNVLRAVLHDEKGRHAPPGLLHRRYVMACAPAWSGLPTSLRRLPLLGLNLASRLPLLPLCILSGLDELAGSLGRCKAIKKNDDKPG